jgi:TRAP-type C4-dicarboxylate transport system permease small subunit
MVEKDIIEKVGDRIVFVAERILALGLMAGILIDFVNVVGRYTGGFTIIGIDEVEIYILIWVAFLGSVAVTWRRQHLRMDVFIESCRLSVKKAAIAVEMIVLLIVTAYAGKESYAYVSRIFALGSISDIARIPMWIPHVAVPLSFFLIALIVVVRGTQLLRVSQMRGEP